MKERGRRRRVGADAEGRGDVGRGRLRARDEENRATVAAAADSVDSVAERYLTREKRPAIR